MNFLQLIVILIIVFIGLVSAYIIFNLLLISVLVIFSDLIIFCIVLIIGELVVNFICNVRFDILLVDILFVVGYIGICFCIIGIIGDILFIGIIGCIIARINLFGVITRI